MRNLTRAIIALPATGKTLKLVDKILSYLLYKCGFEGCTVATALPSPFKGVWYDKKARKFAEDSNIFVMTFDFDPQVITNYEATFRWIDSCIVDKQLGGEKESYIIFESIQRLD